MSASTADAATLVADYLVSQRPDLVGAAARLVDVPTGEEMVGPDSIGAWFYELTSQVIPGGRITDQRLHVTGHAVVVELTVSGHHAGDAYPSAVVRLCLVCDIGEHRITAIRAYYDTAGVR
jgi:ketosteroid isomerase-like protein